MKLNCAPRDLKSFLSKAVSQARECNSEVEPVFSMHKVLGLTTSTQSKTAAVDTCSDGSVFVLGCQQIRFYHCSTLDHSNAVDYLHSRNIFFINLKYL